MHAGSTDSGRLRTPPRKRFRGRQRHIDLNEAFAALPAESVVSQGRMQKTLYRHGAMTTAIFSMQRGATLDGHTIDGEAAIHVLSGRVRVTSDDASLELTADQVMLLNPGVRHEVEALAPSRLLMTVVLEDDDE